MEPATLPVPIGPTSEVAVAADELTHLGFLLISPFPPGAAPSRLLVALRQRPTERHFDPQLVRYWRTGQDRRGHPARLELGRQVPVELRFAWGRIEVVDRFGVANDFVTLGGQLHADEMADGTLVAVFSSSAPILRIGGHSQAEDVVALELGAFFARIMVPIDFEPGAEQALADADPLALYAAFVAFERRRYLGHLLLRSEHPHEFEILSEEAERLRTSRPRAWENGTRLLERLALRG